MPITSLSEFLEQLERQEQLVRVAVKVDPAGEAAAIAQRALRSPQPQAILYQCVGGHPWPVVVNRHRWSRAVAKRETSPVAPP